MESFTDTLLWFWMPVLLLIMTIGVVVLFYIHRRNNKRHFFELNAKIDEAVQLSSLHSEKHFEKFKQGLQQLITELNQRVKANEQRTSAILNQLEEIQQFIRNPEEIEEETNPENKND
jgi:protoporphyrinogen oxidase